MKALTLWSGPYAGGAARRFVELVDGLCARGEKVVLLTAHDYLGHATPELERIALPQGCLRTVRTRLSFGVYRNADRLLAKHRPDVVFVFGLVNGNVLCPAARKLAIPSVVFIRMMEMVLSNNPNIPFLAIPVLRGLGRAAYASAFRSYSRRVFGYASAVVFQHRYQHESYIREHLIQRDFRGPIFYLSNNSNPTWTAGRERYQAVAEPVTIIAANLFWNKGFRTALDAFVLVKQRVPNARLVVLGDGQQECAIRQYASRVEAVEFRGRVADTHQYYASARLLLHPLHLEMGSPNAVLEAAGFGMPMIVSDELTHTVGQKDWVYPAHDPDRLAELWVRALIDDSFHAVLCRESEELGRQYRFDWVAKAQDILAAHNRRQ